MTCWTSKKKMRLIYRVCNFLNWCLFKCFYKIKVFGLEHYFEGSAIIAANHASYYDPSLIGITWPEDIHYLAREPLFRVPLLGWLIRRLNAHPLKGSGADAAVFKVILSVLDKGGKVILFPEGRRTFDDTFSQIRPGIGMLTVRSKAPIIPTYIFGTFDVWPRVKIFPRLFKTMGCVYGTAIRWEDFEHLDKKQAQIQITKKLEESLRALRKWHEDGAKGTPP